MPPTIGTPARGASLMGLSPRDDERPGDDEGPSHRVLPGQSLPQEDPRKDDRKDDAQLVDRRDPRRLADLKRPEVADPREARGDSREHEEHKGPRSRHRDGARGAGDEHDGPRDEEYDRRTDRRREVRVDVLH